MTSLTFRLGEKVVYPSHGVGEITAIEAQSIGGIELRVYVISFPQDKMVLRVPVNRAASSGLRALSDKTEASKIYAALQSKPKIGNKMWSRRAQEYECKINSGDVVAVSEVVRDLYKNVDSDRSYSERAIYEAALHRLASELAIMEEVTYEEATAKLIDVLKDKASAA